MTYSTTASIEEVAGAIEADAARSGMAVRHELSIPDALVIVLTQTAPWYRVMIRALPQQLCWRLQQSGNRAIITCEPYCFWWYVGVILLTCAIFSTLLVYGTTLTLSDWRETSRTTDSIGVFIVLASLPLFFAGFYLLTAIGTDTFWHAIRQRVEADGRLVTPVSSGVSGLFVFCSNVYLVFVIGLGVWCVSEAWQLNDRLSRLVLGGLLACIICLVIIVGFMDRKVAFTQRLIPMLPGLLSLVSIFLFVSIQLPSLVHRNFDTAKIQMLERAAEIIQAWEEIRMWAWACIAYTVLIAAVTAALIGYTLRTALRVWPYQARISRFADHPAMQATVSGVGFLSWFRFLFTTVWAFVAGLILLGMCSIIYGALEAMLDRPIATPFVALPHHPTISLLLVNIAFGRPIGDVTLESVVRMLWISYGLTCLGGLICSVGQLVGARRRALQRLYNERGNDTPEHRRARQMLERPAVKESFEPPLLVIRESRMPYAKSHHFGWLRPLRFIEVSSRCLSLLKDDELEALLAHELAHHLNGNCLTDNVMRLLGRPTFVGDSTVRVLQDMFGYELYADRVAVEKLKADPVALKRCLWKMHHVYAAEGGAALPLIHGLSALRLTRDEYSKALASNLKTLRASKRWRLAVWLYLKQYTSAGEAVYWHPPIADRVAQLKELTGASPTNQFGQQDGMGAAAV